MSNGGAGEPGMAVRYRRRDGTWASSAARQEPSGWWWPIPEDCDGIAEVVILSGGGAAAPGVPHPGTGYGGGE